MNDVGAEPSRTGGYTLVPARSVDEAALVAFASAVWPDREPHERIRASWWRYAEPECAVVALHDATGAVAGLCGGRPSQWVIDGRPHPAVAITDWYVAPGHAGKLIGRRLVRQFQAPDRVMYAFSISDMAVAYLRALGWQGPFPSTFMALPFPRLVRLLHRAGRGDLALDEHVATGRELPGALASALDRIEQRRSLGREPAHMRRGADEWCWRLRIRAERTYRFCVASRAGEPVGYAAVRRSTPGRIRQLGKRDGALLTDLVVAGDDRHALRALATRAVAMAAELGAVAVFAATTTPSHAAMLARLGFLSPSWPLVGKYLGRRAPPFMWLPRGPGAGLAADAMALTLADATIDFDL